MDRPPSRLRDALLRSALTTAMALTSAAATAADAKPLRFSVVSSWAMPYSQLREGLLVGGINYDISQAIGEQLRLPVQYVLVPRLRVDAAAQAGEFDLRCHVNPDWVRGPDNYRWSPPLFELSDALIGHTSAEVPRSIEQIPAGQAVGTVLGFVYPALEERLANGSLKRDDALSVDRMLIKLTLRRSLYGVANLRDIAWYLRGTPDHQIAPWRLILTQAEYRCAVPRAGAIDAGEILAAIERLRASGQIERILARYGGSQVAVVVSSKSAIGQLSRQEVVDLFLGMGRELPDRSLAQLATVTGALRDEFNERVLGKDGAQVKAAWSRLVFGGRGRAPTEFGSPAQARAWIAAHPQAVGVIGVADIDASLRIVYLP